MLVALAQTLKEMVRREDVVCRYGGEEFLVLLPETTLEQGIMKAEQLRSAVAALQLTYQGTTLDSLTVSVGVSASPEHGAEPEVLKATADHALYRAKQGGRNRVQVALTASS